MVSLQSSSLLFSSFPSSTCCSSRRINAAIHVPKLLKSRISVPKLPTTTLVDEFNVMDRFNTAVPLEEKEMMMTRDREINKTAASTDKATMELYMILEAVADRVEMHKNICEQRNNWNTLLLNSINMITLTALTVAGVAATGGEGMPDLALKLSSTLLFSSATGMLVVMNKIQPSQLAEEQRNAARLFGQIRGEIQTILALRSPTERDVKVMMAKVLALDKAYPLPLLGKMLEKFPQTLEPASWWPKTKKETKYQEKHVGKTEKNGWSEKLEMEIREIVEVIKTKDVEDYVKLGNKALKLNKILAISGPLLTGIAAMATPFIGSSSLGSSAVMVSVLAGALAASVNTLQHAGQVGMVFEMYRNCAGSFQLLEETVESTLEETDMEERENGELFEMKVALQLGRSLSELRDLASKSATSRRYGNAIDEFASKLI